MRMFSKAAMRSSSLAIVSSNSSSPPERREVGRDVVGGTEITVLESGALEVDGHGGSLNAGTAGEGARGGGGEAGRRAGSGGARRGRRAKGDRRPPAAIRADTAIEPTAGLGSGLGLQGGFPAASGQRIESVRRPARSQSRDPRRNPSVRGSVRPGRANGRTAGEGVRSAWPEMSEATGSKSSSRS